MFKFTKMHALGNDFVVLDGIAQEFDLTPEVARAIANRNTGVGCDQILNITPETDDRAFGLRIFNSDGSESAQCGNGARCVARYVRDMGYAASASVTFRTNAGILQCTVLDRTNICAALGVPNFIPDEIPFVADRIQQQYKLDLDGAHAEISALSIGNPHAVVFVPDVSAAPVSQLGDKIENHPRFPQRTNVGFAEVVDRKSIRLRVHERGVGETSACGSGASAAAVAGRKLGLLDERVEVNLPGGAVTVEWASEGQQALLTGPASYVFDGQWRSEEHESRM